MSVLGWMKGLLTRGDLDCMGVRKLSSEYLEGDLSPSRLQRFRAHLAECGPCKSFVEGLVSMVRALGGLPQTPLPPHLRSSILDRIAQERARGEGPARL